MGQCGHFLPVLIAMGQFPPPHLFQRAAGTPLVSLSREDLWISELSKPLLKLISSHPNGVSFRQFLEEKIKPSSEINFK